MSTVSGFCEKCNVFRKRHCNGDRNTCMSILFDTIEVLKQENKELKRQLSMCGMKEYLDRMFAAEDENEQLRAQVARMRDTFETIKKLDKTEYTYYGAKARNRYGELPGSGERWKTPYEIATKALSDTPADYHNPADMEALKVARKALAKIQMSSWIPARKTAEEALAEIDKVIGSGDIDKG